MSENTEKSSGVDSIMSESGLGSMNPSPSVSEVSQSRPTAELSVQSIVNDLSLIHI